MSQKTPSPRLATIKMVEETLKNAPEAYTTMSELKRLLPKQINHTTLKEILRYLQESNRITFGVEGILYIPPITPRMKKILEDSWEWTPEGFRKYQPKTHKEK